MMVKRYFYNVGKALFCREQVGNCNIIYDCGGQKLSMVEEVINECFIKEDVHKIDALFISHYDEDHINGIFYLSNNIYIERLILPLISYKDIFMSLGRTTNLDYFNFAFNPYDTLKKWCKNVPIILFQEAFIDLASGERMHFYPNQVPVSWDNFRNEQVIPAKTMLTSDSLSDWVYMPFNFYKIDKIKEDMFFSKFGCNINKDNFKDYWSISNISEKLKIKKIALEIFNIKKDIYNESSMTLYSGPLKKEEKVGSLFTGDFNAKRNYRYLKDYYSLVWNNISVVQIPHHGSYENYNENLIGNSNLSIIPANSNSRICKKPKTLFEIKNRSGISAIFTDCISNDVYTLGTYIIDLYTNKHGICLKQCIRSLFANIYIKNKRHT